MSKAHRERPRRFYQQASATSVNFTCGIEDPEHDSVGANLLRNFDLVKHDLEFFVRVAKNLRLASG